MTTKNDQDDVLLTKLNVAVKAANEAETSVKTAQAEMASRARAVGLLLLEARKLHHQVKDFEAYLKRVDGLQLSRAYDFMRLAGGKTTDEELRKEARERKRRSRAKPKKTLPAPAPEPKSKTLPGPAPEPKQPEPEVSVTVTESADPQTAAVSARSLQEFQAACRCYLPELNEADLKKARAFVTLDEWRSKTKKEAA